MKKWKSILQKRKSKISIILKIVLYVAKCHDVQSIAVTGMSESEMIVLIVKEVCTIKILESQHPRKLLEAVRLLVLKLPSFS